MTTDTTPASSDARAPKITRDSTSRPISSVPNQCAALGALRIVAKLAATGSYGARTGAPSAITTNATTTTRPNADAGRRNRRRSTDARVDGGRATRAAIALDGGGATAALIGPLRLRLRRCAAPRGGGIR